MKDCDFFTHATMRFLANIQKFAMATCVKEQNMLEFSMHDALVLCLH